MLNHDDILLISLLTFSISVVNYLCDLVSSANKPKFIFVDVLHKSLI